MGNRPRLRASNEAHSLNLYPADVTLGWRVIRRVSQARGERKLALGEWREVHDEYGNLQGYQVLATFKTDLDLPSGASSTSITVSECELNAGLRGKSRTYGLDEDERLSRRNQQTGKALPPEDAIERARAKVREWPLAHGDRARRVYPKPA
jgi:hypothetical protein